MKSVEIITIGDELLIGQVTDTNSVWMAQQLNKLGLDVVRKTSVGDDAKMMLQAFDRAMNECDIVLVTGGIGPTKDDITKQTLCRFFNTELVHSDEVLEDIKTLFIGRNIPLNSLNRSQALVPKAATIIHNRWGTAPITWFEQDDKVLVSMPGVPYEMRGVMTDEILPRLQKKISGTDTIIHYTYCVKGYPESVLAEFLNEWESALPSNIKLAYLPTPGMIRLRLSGRSAEKEQLEEEMNREGTALKSLLGNSIYAEEDIPLGGFIGKLLKERMYSISTAESCSGGYLAHMLTAESGASNYYKGGIVAYSNEIKHSLLGVKEETIRCYGAVSEETAVEMAKNAQRIFNTECAIATTGIAGPTGGTQEKPIGTVWIAVMVNDKLKVERKQFGRIRENNIVRTAQTALLMLQELLQEESYGVTNDS